MSIDDHNLDAPCVATDKCLTSVSQRAYVGLRKKHARSLSFNSCITKFHFSQLCEFMDM